MPTARATRTAPTAIENTTSVTALNSNCVDGPVWTVMVPGLSSKIAVDKMPTLIRKIVVSSLSMALRSSGGVCSRSENRFSRRPSMEMRSPE